MLIKPIKPLIALQFLNPTVPHSDHLYTFTSPQSRQRLRAAVPLLPFNWPAQSPNNVLRDCLRCRGFLDVLVTSPFRFGQPGHSESAQKELKAKRIGRTEGLRPRFASRVRKLIGFPYHVHLQNASAQPCWRHLETVFCRSGAKNVRCAPGTPRRSVARPWRTAAVRGVPGPLAQRRSGEAFALGGAGALGAGQGADKAGVGTRIDFGT